ncbi:MAG: methyltransferase domain-containing protein [Caldilineaceae bacterium]|nr:methyltransferase domain-containing protein [Caldilineaceae bacterium]
MQPASFSTYSQEAADAWDENAAYWDDYMGEGNDFVNLLCWPAIERLLAPAAGMRVLDVACGNGLTSRRLGRLGARVTAFDVSAQMIERARARTTAEDGEIDYRVIDGGDDSSLLALGEKGFDAALSNMALFDMAAIDPLFASLTRLLKPGSAFVFSLMHPCFNNMHTIHMAEREDRDGELVTTYSMKVTGYISPSVKLGLAIPGQQRPHPYFHRPLQMLLGAGFAAGFAMDGLEERAFPADHPAGRNPLGWGANYAEIPPVMVVRMRLR